VDGREYRMGESAFAIKVGTAEQWHIVNKTGDAHPFHLHTNSLQLVAVNGKPVASATLRRHSPRVSITSSTSSRHVRSASDLGVMP